MRVDTRPRRKNAGRAPVKSAPGFLQWLRGRDCIFADMGGCEGRMEAAHLDFAGGKGIGTKVADRYAVPMCSAHHRIQHSGGWPRFLVGMLTTKGAMLLAAAKLWNAWPGRVAWERKQEAA